ncbi:otogelin-like protein [Lingula anatina]|uniref:Otogelin-like protein n=1 Tax=Lingula anatina TaxID=7574 RepID=A0A1S3J5Y4_LINAN|nr:otogelin-like protein [Lingula anatina]|eukprot:XP_013405718.1 otogelin-like protein [Lingula anatina]
MVCKTTGKLLVYLVVFLGLASKLLVEGVFVFKSLASPGYSWGFNDDGITTLKKGFGIRCFRVLPGLTGHQTTVSFESKDHPDYFLCNVNSVLKLVKRPHVDRHHRFARHASFKPTVGFWHAGYTVYEAMTRSNFYIRQSNFTLRVEKYDDTEKFRQEASFRTELESNCGFTSLYNFT